jgi:GT2 family glycosyltransferase
MARDKGSSAAAENMPGLFDPPPRAQSLLGHLSFVGALRARQAFAETAKAELDAFLAGGERLCLAPRRNAASITVVVVLYNQAHLTLRCLRSLLQQRDASFETVIVDNASTDQTSALLERITGATIVRNPGNLGFLRAANEGAARGSAPILLFLNNDALPMPDALQRAAARLDADDSIGALSGRIVFPHGRLQEAGPIVFANGFVIGWGMNAAPDRVRFRLPRETDFANGAFLATPRRLFVEHGGFDETFKPAYHEDTDYSFRLRSAGFRIVYDPAIRVVHLAHGSKTSIFAPFRQLARTRVLFQRRHGGPLEKRIAPNWLNYAKVCLGIANKRWILVVGDGTIGARRRMSQLARIFGDQGGWVSVISSRDSAATIAAPFWSQGTVPSEAADGHAALELLAAYVPFVGAIVAVGKEGRDWLQQALSALGAMACVPKIVLDSGSEPDKASDAVELSAAAHALGERRASIADAARILA